MILKKYGKKRCDMKYISMILKSFVFLFIFCSNVYCEILKDNVFILEDQSQVMTIDQILSLKNQSRFKNVESMPFNVGYSNSVFWIKIVVDKKNNNKNLVLDQGWSYYSLLEFYFPIDSSNDKYQKIEASLSWHDEYARYFPIKQFNNGVYYLRVGSNRMLSVALDLNSVEGFVQKTSITSIVFGVTTGVTLAMFIYNLLIYFSLRDRAYLFYVLFQISSFIYFITKQWTPLSVLNTGLVTLVFANGAGIGFCHFLICVLDLDKEEKLFKNILRIISIIIFVNVVLGLVFLPLQNFSKVTGFVNLMAFLVGILISFVFMLKKNKLARLIFFSWVFAASIFAVYILENFGLIPKLGILYVNFAVSTEAILMSFVLAYRIKLLKQDFVNAELVAEAKSTFLASMSHEIRTPITAILGYSDIIMKRDLPDELKRYLNNVLISANHLLSIINDIIDIAKIEAGKIAIENISFDLEELIRKVMRISAHNACARGNELVFLIEPGMPTELSGDPLRIEQILINLISNASKFTTNGDICIRIYTIADNTTPPRIDDAVLTLGISVSDTGIGIPKEKQGSIFHVFEQADSSTTRKFGGSGLGLAISRQLARLMGGDLTFVSEENRGSVFTLEVPFANVVRGSEERKLPSRLPLGSSVLVVEDNPLACECLAVLLRRLCLTPVVAGSGAVAVEMLRQDAKKYSLLIVDQEMPGMSGLDTIETLFKNGLPPGTPIILTRNVVSQKEDIDSEIHGNGVFVLQKPISIISLHSALCEIFGDGKEKTEEKNKDNFDYDVLNNKKVLVVDDNQFNREVLDVILSQVNIESVTVSSGFEAIEILKSGKSFDVVLMDVEMPEMDGLTATKIIRNELCLVDLPIIALTAKVIRGDRDVCLESGMNDYLSKPIDTQALFNKLKVWTDRS